MCGTTCVDAGSLLQPADFDAPFLPPSSSLHLKSASQVCISMQWCEIGPVRLALPWRGRLLPEEGPCRAARSHADEGRFGENLAVDFRPDEEVIDGAAILLLRGPQRLTDRSRSATPHTLTGLRSQEASPAHHRSRGGSNKLAVPRRVLSWGAQSMKAETSSEQYAARTRSGSASLVRKKRQSSSEMIEAVSSRCGRAARVRVALAGRAGQSKKASDCWRLGSSASRLLG